MVILVQGRSLVSAGHVTIGNLLAFLLYQEYLSHSIRVSPTCSTAIGQTGEYALRSFHVYALHGANNNNNNKNKLCLYIIFLNNVTKRLTSRKYKADENKLKTIKCIV